MTRLSVLAAGAVLVATSTMASCGFDYATDRDYTPGAGVNDRSGVVDVLAAVVVSKQAGSGTFVAGLSNGSTTETISADSLTGTAPEGLTVADFDPLEIAPGGFLNLATVDGIEVSGDFTAGDFLTLSVGFDNGEKATVAVPVVTACDEYADLDDSEPSPFATFTTNPSPTPTPPPTPGASAGPTTTGSASAEPSPAASVTTLAPIVPEYSCDEAESETESSDAATAEAGG